MESPEDSPVASPGHLWPRWIFLRALGLIFFSAFYSLAFQIYGLVGIRGILPAGDYLQQVASALGSIERFWYAPTVFWLGAGDGALRAVVAAGLVASVLLTLNVRPRLMVGLCTIVFLSCIAVLQDFSSYQSDGMLLEAGFVSVFFAPRGTLPGLGAIDPPSRFSRFMLEWEWFRIYFESGVGKLASGDPHWRNLTAMDEYYQNGPLPSWIGWYVQHLPHGFHASVVIFTLLVELVLVWFVFGNRRMRLFCFLVVTALQCSIILTANYAFLNYLVLCLGFLLLDDAYLTRAGLHPVRSVERERSLRTLFRKRIEVGVLSLTLYATILTFFSVGLPSIFTLPSRALEPFRFANAYGLFAMMTENRYEIEFQGSNDGRTWIAYPFRYKPQNIHERPGFFAPYQPRFDWNLWFASLGPGDQSPWVVLAEQRLVEGSNSVIALFRGDPFNGHPPKMVRTVLWQYWFTDMRTMGRTGEWWRRRLLGPYAPTVMRGIDGKILIGGGQ
ncbi:MAG: lipase maturation factor family protein [Gemmatimonadaceae bacterium]